MSWKSISYKNTTEIPALENVAGLAYYTICSSVNWLASFHTLTAAEWLEEDSFSHQTVLIVSVFHT